MKKTEKETMVSIPIGEVERNIYFVENQYEREPISNNIDDALNDFYNIMHLLENSWPRKKGYRLTMKDAGYNILRKNKKVAWIGIPKKRSYLFLMLYYGGEPWNNAEKDFNGLMEVYDYNEDIWVYGKLRLSDIVKEKTEEGQRKILENWLSKIVEKIFRSGTL
jgi:hypothetical protein